MPSRASRKIAEFVVTILSAVVVALILPTTDAAFVLLITVGVALYRLLKP